MITTIEELSLNAWAALQTMLYDGWVIRFANGYTKRANSVNPIYPSSMGLDEKLQFCESLYRKKGLPVVFKLTPDIYPRDLDKRLEERGYRKDSPTSVQTADIEFLHLQATSEIKIQESLPDEWLDSFRAMSAVSGQHRETLRKILTNIIPRHCFVSLTSGNKIVACGVGVLQSGYIGLFDIVTDPDFRRHGYGQQVVQSILMWGKENGAAMAYLQVMLNNPPALRLYEKLGFLEQYQYWYRVRE
ncbi:MAG: GNAT family N-acetyltransferase [Anaerolineales bacterium]